MNIALGAFILTLLFLPAVSYRLAINRQENLKELLSTFSLTDSIWVFSIVPILIHIILVPILVLSGLEVKFDLILNVLYSNKDFKIQNDVFTLDLVEFLGYCTLAIFLGYIFGIFSNSLETRNNFFSRLLGLGNEWYEVFEGKILESSGEKDNIENIDLVYIDVLSNTKEATTLYSGILVNYYYKPKSTELEFLVLQATTRRDLRKEQISDISNVTSGKSSHYSSETSKPIKIPGEYFIVPMKEVLNVNVSYLYITAGNEVVESLEE